MGAPNLCKPCRDLEVVVGYFYLCPELTMRGDSSWIRLTNTVPAAVIIDDSMTNRYTYTHASLLGADGKYSAFNCIHAASKTLKGRGLTNQSINKAMDALMGLNQCTGMKGMESLGLSLMWQRSGG